MLWSQSVDSATDDEDPMGDRRGSVANSSALPSRRGSRLFDFLEKKKKNDRKRYKDKEGFVWRRMVHEDTEELPRPRAPHLGQYIQTLPDGTTPHLGQQWASPWLNPSEAGGGTTASISTPLTQPPLPGMPASLSPPTTDQTLRKISMLSNSCEPPLCTQPPVQLDSDSLTSFKTCPSDSSLPSLLVPRQVADTYKSPIPMPVAVNATLPPLGTRIPPPHSPPPQTPLKSTPLPQPAPSSYPQAGVTPAPTTTTPVAAPVQANMSQALTQQPQHPNAITRPVQVQTSENVIGGVRHLVRDGNW